MEVVKVVEKYLRINEPITTADSVKFRRFVDYLPTASSHLNTHVPITINVENVDNFFLLEESRFIIEIDLVKKSNNARYNKDDLITIVNNGLLFLFNKATLKFNDTTVEDYLNVGHTTLIQGLLKYHDGFSSNLGLRQCWSLDDNEYSATLDKNPGFANRQDLLFQSGKTVGKAKFVIPFSHIFGFQGKILSGIKVSAQFERVINNDAIFKSNKQTVAGTDDYVDGVINISSLKWRIPYIDLNTEMASQISEALVSKPTIPFKFITEHVEEFPVPETKILDRALTTISGPEKILGFVVAFQTARSDNQKANISAFDHIDVLDASISLNNVAYPGINLYGGVDGLEYMEHYDRYADFRKFFTNFDPEFSPKGWQTEFPIYCFDTSFQEDRINGNTMAIKFQFKFSKNVPPNTTAYIIIFRERVMSISTDGTRKMKVEYINSY